MTTDLNVTVAPHPLLAPRAFTASFDRPLGEISSPGWLLELLKLDAPGAQCASSDEVRSAVRDMLRHGGYKPTGRGKPASEYLLRAAGENVLGSINAAVDACNVVSLHSGLPISLVDLERAHAPFSIRVAPEEMRYVFNASGQEIDLGGLLCLFDAGGACANAVKDSQRTKTHAGTLRTLSIIWGIRADEPRCDQALVWYRRIVEDLGGVTADVTIEEIQ